MDPPLSIQDCIKENQIYPHGSEICMLMSCTICSNGLWLDSTAQELAEFLGQPFCRGMRII